MGRVLEGLPPGGRVAIVRLRSLGDCVLTTPALGLLKAWRKDLRVAVVVEPRFRGVFEDHPDVDEVLGPGAGTLRRWRPQLVVNLHGGTRSAWLTAASGARYRAGFGHFRYQAIYNLRIPRAQEILGVKRTVHTAEHLASAMFWLGVAESQIPRARLGGAPGAPGTTAVIHPVAARPDKTWSVDGFLAVAEQLRRNGLEPVFIGAETDDLSPFSAFRTVRGASLGEVRELMGSASLFVGNDSGPAHMAAAAGLPVVVIFGASDPAIWGPWRTAAAVVKAPGGIAKVETAEVLDAIARLGVHV